MSKIIFLKKTYSNDRTAPRMKKGEFSKMVVTKELYKRFLKEFPEYKGMSWKVFYQTWLDIAEKIRYKAINNPLGVKLGGFSGEIKLQFLPYKFEAVDYNTSIKLGEKVKFLNIENRGKVARVKWERREAVKRNKILQFYAFDETRELTALVKEYILNNPDKVRVARNTLGGVSVWRQKMKKYD